MARSTHALSSFFRGQVGNRTFYVRHGQQICYERTPRAAHKHVESSGEVDELLLLAKRWRDSLAEHLLDIPLADLYAWAKAIVRVAESGQSEVFYDEVNGAWESSEMRIVDGYLCYKSGGDYVASQWNRWGTVVRYLSDYPVNIYPTEMYFVAPSGILLESSVSVGRKVIVPPDTYRAAKAPVQAPQARLAYCSLASNGVMYVRWRGDKPLPSPFNPFSVQGWRGAGVDVDGVRVYPYMVLDGQGNYLHLAVII